MHHIDFFMKLLLPCSINLLQLATQYYCLSPQGVETVRKHNFIETQFFRTFWMNFEYALSHTPNEFSAVWDGFFSEEQKKKRFFDNTSIVSIKIHLLCSPFFHVISQLLSTVFYSFVFFLLFIMLLAHCLLLFFSLKLSWCFVKFRNKIDQSWIHNEQQRSNGAAVISSAKAFLVVIWTQTYLRAPRSHCILRT